MNKSIRSIALFLMAFTSTAYSAPLTLSTSPLFLSSNVPPLNMLVVGKDHKLYYEAYNDASDLNEDDVLDIGYQPNLKDKDGVTPLDYYGYFDSYKCYTYNSGSKRFDPASVTSTKKCSGNWSGDFLNYLTMSRMDVLRKVLYGGYRVTDTTGTSTDTVLERVFIPQDSHGWGKEYTSEAVNGFKISDYTPLATPAAGKRHLFVSFNDKNNVTEPLLRYITDSSKRIWDWASSESNNSFNAGTFDGKTPTNFSVRVKVCDKTIGLEDNCTTYKPSTTEYYKPTGLLHKYGESNQMLFGLLTGTYTNNLSGGVVRKLVSSFKDEVNTDGRFTNIKAGIVYTLNTLKTINFSGSYSDCLLSNPIKAIADGTCAMWGNPIGEMMYETLRYYSGQTTASSDFTYSGTDKGLDLSQINTWPALFTNTPGTGPYTSAPYPSCAKPYMMVMSDINPSYDSDKVPGSNFNSYSGSGGLSSLNATTEGQTIWDNEPGLSGTKSVFIGQSGGTYDGAPTPKNVTSLGNIRGLSPEEPTKQGSYYSASVAYFGHTHDINPNADKDQKVTTLSIGLASPLPQIKIPVGGKTITILPFAKSAYWGSSSIDRTDPTTQPTNSIADFYVDTISPTYGKFRVNFEDQEKGNDFDLDGIFIYEYTVNANNTVTVTITADYAAGGITQHAGYVISGSTNDGTYLDVRDSDTTASNDINSKLDTPPGVLPGQGNINRTPKGLPLSNTRIFTPNSTTSAIVLKDPLWYAAKYGAFTEDPKGTPVPNNLPDQTKEWDANGDGIPDTYFLVNNPTRLKKQLEQAFAEIFQREGASASVATNSTSLNSGTTVYQAQFNSTDWSGKLFAFPLTGGVIGSSSWDAGKLLQNPVANNRVIMTYNSSTMNGVPFRWSATNLTASQQAALNKDAGGTTDGKGSSRVDYLRGDATNETCSLAPCVPFRTRATSKLGDIVNSSPIYVGPSAANLSRTGIIYAGANDGMLHGFDATSIAIKDTNGKIISYADGPNAGKEILAYVPSSVYSNLSQLTATNYSHRYYVDGSPVVADATVNGTLKTLLISGLGAGGQGVFALDITDSTNFQESKAADIVQWEFTDADDKDLGYTFSQPVITKVCTARVGTACTATKWVAIFGNGYNNTQADGNASTTGRAVLYVLDLDKPIGTAWALNTNFRKIDTLIGDTITPNGLSSPNIMDVDNDGITDYIYAGDLRGNMWKFEPSSDLKTWAVSLSGSPLYTAKDAAGTPQPITSRPAIGPNPKDYKTPMVYFGTGKYLEPCDTSSSCTTVINTTTYNYPQQSFYAVWDKAATVAGKTELRIQTLTESTINGNTYRNPNDNTAMRWRPDATTPDYLGWYLDLPTTGERTTGNPQLVRKALLFNTLIPSTDPCKFGGTGWLMALNPTNGGQLTAPPFDTNNDGFFTSKDIITGGLQIGAAIGGTTIILPGVGGDSAIGISSKTDGTLDLKKLNLGTGTGRRVTWRELIND